MLSADLSDLPLFGDRAEDPSPGRHVDITGHLTNFANFGQRTLVERTESIPYFVNEFWTAGQRQSHSLHEVSYRACFKAQLPEFFIRLLTQPGDTVFDPFMGRGTTPIQAALMGRRPAGNDINPLSTLLTRPRLNPPSVAQVAERLSSIDWEDTGEQPDELLAFYHPATLARLSALQGWIAREAPVADASPDPVADWIRMVAINRLSGHSPGFFSGRSMPPNQAVSVKSQLRINEKLGVSPPPRDVIAIILKKTRTLLADGGMPEHPPHALMVGTADHTPEIADASIALVVTSPPFLDIVHYAADNWLRCWFAGIDVGAIDIAMHRTEAAWEAMVKGVLLEQARILKPGGHVAFEVGEVRNGKVLLERLVWQAAEDLPFDRLGVMVNAQVFTKTANCWGVSNGKSGTNTNRIVLLRRR
ncbi:Methyltransferase [Sphingomonas sp. EC-HK361]|uniref:DNA methyltransferase n=1 Tax=Sphingomonas sp. EC-HK361 TaxID=2038397 RepID=UPI001256F41D|nr:DNA methyltransferase [Sphingomonas sp. EC-HK361]VVT16325.1 Methyltransferase [Sphingomonas sp. EC-HK361]